MQPSFGIGRSAAIPDRSDRCPRPARTKGAAIVTAAVKAGPADIVPFAVITVITRGRVDIPGAPIVARHDAFLGIERLAVARGLMIARQEAVAMPNRLGPFMKRRSLGGGRKQRQNDSDG